MESNLQKLFCSGMFLISAFCSIPAIASPDFGPVAMGEFYQSLPVLPANNKLGELIKSEKISTSMPGVDAWKIAYVSSDINGHKTLVTGIVAAPSHASKQARPIMAWAHGTTGTAENCGPSQLLDPAQPLNQYFLMNGNSWSDYGLPAMKSFIDAGYVIVATDYQGLGGGGKHQYTVAATQARDVINAIRAATQIKQANAGTKAMVYGWSQGGGATLAAAGLNDYLHVKGTANDNIDIVGFVAMAPFDVAATIPENIKTDAEATQYLQSLIEMFGANIFNFAHFAQNAWGMVAAFPELRLEDIFTTEGAQVVNHILERKCMHATSDTFEFMYGKDYKKLLRTDIQHASAWINAYRKSSVNTVKPLAPVIIYFGDQDTTVPPVMGKLYYEQMCKIGGNVTRIQLPGTQNHFTTPGVAEPLYIPWVAERFAGKPVTNSCSSL